MNRKTLAMIDHALAIAELHFEYDEESKRCFNLFTFLEQLESDLFELTAPLNFDLDERQVARFLWCLISENPGGDTFRGCPILGLNFRS